MLAQGRVGGQFPRRLNRFEDIQVLQNQRLKDTVPMRRQETVSVLLILRVCTFKYGSKALY